MLSFLLSILLPLLTASSPAPAAPAEDARIFPLRMPPRVDPCKVFGQIYIEKNRAFSDLTVYIEDSQGLADLLVYKEDVSGFADKEGIWYITDTRGFADYKVYIEKNRGMADFAVFYTPTRGFAGCN